MNKLFLVALIVGIFTSSAMASVKKVYVASHAGGYSHYVIECSNGNRYTDITQKSNGDWHRGAILSKMGDRYRNLSINEVARKLCN